MALGTSMHLRLLCNKARALRTYRPSLEEYLMGLKMESPSSHSGAEQSYSWEREAYSLNLNLQSKSTRKTTALEAKGARLITTVLTSLTATAQTKWWVSMELQKTLQSKTWTLWHNMRMCKRLTRIIMNLWTFSTRKLMSSICLCKTRCTVRNIEIILTIVLKW